MPQQPGSYSSARTADNDVLTILLIIGFALVLAAIVFVLIRSAGLFGTVLPGIS